MNYELNMNKTRLIRNLFTPRQHQLDRYATDAEYLQRKALIRRLKKGKIGSGAFSQPV